MAQPYERNPEKLANLVYANRMGNGPPESCDGYRFRGRGLIRIIGRANYASVGAALGLDLESQPESLLEPRNAAMSAAWFWNTLSGRTWARPGSLLRASADFQQQMITGPLSQRRPNTRSHCPPGNNKIGCGPWPPWFATASTSPPRSRWRCWCSSGFARTYYLRPWFDVPPINLLLHLHSIAFTAWFVLFIIQTRLIAAQNYRTHMQFGIAGVVLALLVFVFGAITAIVRPMRRACAPWE